ncbi:hypothetical protein Droror1_Dr00005460 [Drosera rotundifolia]
MGREEEARGGNGGEGSHYGRRGRLRLRRLSSRRRRGAERKEEEVQGEGGLWRVSEVVSVGVQRLGQCLACGFRAWCLAEDMRLAIVVYSRGFDEVWFGYEFGLWRGSVEVFGVGIRWFGRGRCARLWLVRCLRSRAVFLCRQHVD